MYFCFSVKVNWDNSKFSNDLYCLQLNNNNAKNISNLHHFYSTNKEISIYWWWWRHILHRTIKNPNFRSICHDHHLHVGFLSDSLSGFPSAIFRSFPKWIHNINIKKKLQMNDWGYGPLFICSSQYPLLSKQLRFVVRNLG